MNLKLDFFLSPAQEQPRSAVIHTALSHTFADHNASVGGDFRRTARPRTQICAPIHFGESYRQQMRRVL